jgi:L-iditol 2-dehydrogenase
MTERAAMLALRLHPDGQVRLHHEPIPVPGAGEALIRVTAVGLCGSDRHWMVDRGIGDATLDAPLILGHEFGGTVETGRLAGRRVAVDPANACGICELCRSGASNLCQAIQFAGHGRTDGALREWLAWPESCLVPVSDRVSDAESAIVEPLAVAFHALDLGRLRDSQTVAVIGSGPIGVLLVALARKAGAAVVIATDPLPHRLAAAAAFGATRTVEVSPAGDQGAAILEATGGRGCDLVFEVAGENTAVETAIDLARPGSRVILVGIPSDDRTSFTASVARRKGLTLKLARRSTPDTFRRAVEVAESGELDLGRLVSRRAPLDGADEALAGFVARDGMKVIIEPSAARITSAPASGAHAGSPL